MDSNQKKFGIYVFLSTFSRNLIEVFIPVILYKFGFEIYEVLFYYLVANIVSLILSYPFVELSKKYSTERSSKFINGVLSSIVKDIK